MGGERVAQHGTSAGSRLAIESCTTPMPMPAAPSELIVGVHRESARGARLLAGTAANAGHGAGPVKRIFNPARAGVGHARAYLPDLAETIRLAAGQPEAPIYPFPGPVVHALAPFNETAREMPEMIYLWRRPLRLIDGKLRRFLNDVPATPLDEALRTTLQGPGRA